MEVVNTRECTQVKNHLSVISVSTHPINLDVVLHSQFTRKAVEKVQWWLNRTDTEDQKPGGELVRKKDVVDLSSKEPEFVETLNMKNRAEKLNEARKQLYEDDSSILSGSMPVTSRAVKVSKPSQPVFPSVDMRVGRTYSPLYLSMQDVQVSSAEFSSVSSFPFSFSLMRMVSVIGSPEVFYVPRWRESWILWCRGTRWPGQRRWWWEVSGQFITTMPGVG